MDAGVTINRPPRDGNMAFVQSPDGISIELLQGGEPLVPAMAVNGEFGKLVVWRPRRFAGTSLGKMKKVIIE